MTVLATAAVALRPDLSKFPAQFRREFAASERAVEQALRGLRDQQINIDVTADTDKAEAAVEALEQPRTLDVVADAVVAGAEGELADLETDRAVDVVADAQTTAARSALDDLEQDRQATVEADADTEAAEEEIEGLGDAGGPAGVEAGRKLGAGIISALTALPIAGTVVGIGVAVGASILDGLQNEVRESLFSARTGLDEVTTAQFGRAAGEAYANNFGESIAANLDTARIAKQAGLIFEDANQRDIEAIIAQLSTVAGVLEEDIPNVARAAGTAIKTGLADNVEGAFDLLVRGTQSGLNVSEDLLDVIDEYGTQFRKVGLDGQVAFGLIRQALQAGARDTDIAADAIKEFSIRAVDGSVLSAAGFEALGLSAQEMTAQIAAGGEGAAAGLDVVLDRLRAMEDPVARDAAAVALFGTQAEDLGAALFAMDPTTAVQALGEVRGAAQGVIDTLGDDSAAALESAKRNIELAADGIKGALATAFAPQIQGFSTFVSENREQVISFLLEAANRALDVGRAMVEGAAAGVEGFGAFVADTGPAVIGALSAIFEALDKIPGVDLTDTLDGFERARGELLTLRPVTAGLAEDMRTNLIENGLDPVQARLNEVGIPLVAQAAFHDATVALQGDVAAIGTAADGSRLQVDLMNGSFATASAEGATLSEQIQGAVGALREQIRAGNAAGVATDELTETYQANRESLIRQVESMGASRQRAEELVDSYGAVPDLVETGFTQPGIQPALDNTSSLRQRMDGIPSNVDTSFTTPGLQTAMTELSEYSRMLDRIHNRSVSTRINQIIDSGGNTGGGRASGGPVLRGTTYLVGEEGQEFFTPGQTGWISDAEQTKRILAGLGTHMTTPAAAAAPVAAAPGPTRVYQVGVNMTRAEFDELQRQHDYEDRVLYGRARRA